MLHGYHVKTSLLLPWYSPFFGATYCRTVCRERETTSDEASRVKHMASWVCQFILLILIGKYNLRKVISSESVLSIIAVLPLLVRGTAEVSDQSPAGLVGCRSSEASNDFDRAKFEQANHTFFDEEVGLFKQQNTHISSEILSGNIWLHFQGITKHPGHGVLPENDNLLCKEF